MIQTDVLVIGSGVAGLLFALKAARFATVTLVTKRDISDTNTNMAQGGIAAVWEPTDSADLHIKDTMDCGVGLCREDIVRIVVGGGPDRVRELLELGVDFTRSGGRLSLGREGGHSKNRIVHCRDLTGREVQRTLLERVLAEPNVTALRDHMAVGLVTERHLRSGGQPDEHGIYGAYVLNVDEGRVDAIAAKRTVLATGGAGKVYLYTSNPDVATGDGVAMAYRAGARVANLEFVQFHPTCLYHPDARSFLLSEALRGEGGVLRRPDGVAFMADHHPLKDLAPRDIVARAIDGEIKRTGSKCVYLDMTHLAKEFLRERFPNIYDRCRAFGIDIAREPIPVVPATHYFCGGVDVDEWGRSSLRNLFTLGEAAHTGLHGANRLASNSLLEAVVFAERAATHLEQDAALRGERIAEPEPWEEEHTEVLSDSVIIDHDWDAARSIMWDYVGIVRNDNRLEIAGRRMAELRRTIEQLYWKSRINQDLIELRNVVLVGELVIRCARQRKESRGLHFTETYPNKDERFRRDTVLEISRED